jgi:hypothetical protein
MTSGSAAADHSNHEAGTATTKASGHSIGQHFADHSYRDEVPVPCGSNLYGGAWARADMPLPVRAKLEHASVRVRTSTRSATRRFSDDAGLRVPRLDNGYSDGTLRAVEGLVGRTSRGELHRRPPLEGLNPACRHACAS